MRVQLTNYLDEYWNVIDSGILFGFFYPVSSTFHQALYLTIRELVVLWNQLLFVRCINLLVVIHSTSTVQAIVYH